jgi:peptide/nickel transport system ATP-binding protein
MKPSLPLLRINDLSIDFVGRKTQVPAVRNISLELFQGETLALVGESGSGKSVTALSVLQLLPAPSARIINGEILFSPNENAPIDLLTQNRKQMREIRGNRIGMIFQEPMSSLNPLISCGKQVSESIIRHEGFSPRHAHKKTVDLFEKVKLPYPTEIYHVYPHQISGGQKQRVMIAMAIACKPALLICDEPTTALDTTVQFSVLSLLKELQQSQNMGILFITHDLGIVSEIADRIAVMRKGQIIEYGQTNDIFRHPQKGYTRGLLQCRPSLHKKGERLPVVDEFLEMESISGTREEEVIVPMAKLRPEAEIFHHPIEFVQEDEFLTSQTLVEVKNLNVWYPSKTNFLGQVIEYSKAVQNLNFSVYKGETLGIVGESGCGKTTLGRALLRLVKPHSGKIIYNGENLTRMGERSLKKLRQDIQIVFQDPYSSLNPRIRIGHAIAEPLRFNKLSASRSEARDAVWRLLKKVNLDPTQYYRYPHEFSGGQRQRIVIARALIMQPSFVVFDESVSALDVSVQAQILNLINDLKREFGFTVIFISHDLSIIRYLSDRIMVMNQGRIEEIGPAEQIYMNPSKLYTRRLIEAIPMSIV